MRIFTIATFAILSFFSTAAAASSADSVGSDLIVNGVLAIHFSQAAGSLIPSVRAQSAAHRLKELPYWGSVTVSGEGASRKLMIGPDAVLTLGAEDAAAAHTTVDVLANGWAAKLQGALNLPPLKVSDNFAELALGRSQTILVSGSLADRAKAITSDPKVASVGKVSSGFVIKALGIGSAIVSITSGTSQENVQVTVAPYAVALPQTLKVSVTGSPASAQTVQGAAEMALKTQLSGLPDAKISMGSVVGRSLEAGKSASFDVQVSATSPSGVPSKGLATVTVQNVGLGKRPDDFLWYSNKPETVKASQSLFSSSLKLGNSVRLLYHHMNGTMGDMYLRVEIVNEGNATAHVAITPGDSKPNFDPVRAGFLAADQFLHGWVEENAEIVAIPAGSVLPVSFRRLSPGETSSGLCVLRLLDGPPDLLVRADSLPPLQLDEHWANTIFSSTPWHEVGSHPANMYDKTPCEANSHIYADPYTLNTLSYSVGGRPGFYRIGQKPLAQVDQEGSLDGNFGVFDTLQATVSNPTASAADVEFVFEASAGYGGGIFLIDGQFVETRLLKPKGSERIARVHLNPGESRAMKIVTIPISGCSYPATIFIRPIVDVPPIGGM